jgi:hypothetical protein
VALPEKREELMALGYEFSGEGRCSGKDCHQYIEWWITPHGRKMPFNVIDVKDESKPFPQPILRTVRTPHHTTCPNANDFRKRK